MRRVAARGWSLVPGGRWDAADQLGAPISSLPVLRGAGRDRDPERAGRRGCATLPVGSGEPRRLSRESCVATRRLGAAVWRIGRRLRSGTAPDVPSARR